MTDTALLPPDPERPGRYWLKTDICAAPEIWEWHPKDRYWRQGGRWVSADAMRLYDATLAIPHRIPGPAELEALHKLVREIHDRQPKHEMRILRSLYGGRVVLQRSMSASAYADAAAMLRAALETKETT